MLKPRRPEPTILLYHRVAAESFDPWGLAVTPANFEAQMHWLARNRTVMPLAEFAQRHRDRRLPQDAVAVTFDDGYACNAETAVPILQRLSIPATIFLPAELIERGREFWWDELQNIVLGAPHSELQLGDKAIPIGERHADDRQWVPNAPPGTSRQKAFIDLWSSLRERPPAQIEEHMAELRRQSPRETGARPSHRPMTIEQVRSATAGVEFGSHALTHPSLPKLDHSDKEREIVDSVALCEQLVGSRPRTFAFPFGDHDGESEALAERAGFLCACATGQRHVSRSSPMFALPRMQVGDWPAERLGRVLAG